MIRKGDKIEVVRGRKVPIGTKGTVKWTGENQYGPSVGFVVEGEEDQDTGLTFTDAKNVRVIEDAAPARPATPANGAPRPQAAPAPTALLTQETLDKLTGEIDTLRAALQVANERADRAEKQAQDGVALAQKLSDKVKNLEEVHLKRALDAEEKLSDEVDALKAEIAALDARKLAPAPIAKVDPLALERAAKFVASQTEGFVLAALRAQLGGATPTKAPEAPAPKDEPKGRILDLDDEPQKAPKAEEPPASVAIPCTGCKAPLLPRTKGPLCSRCERLRDEPKTAPAPKAPEAPKAEPAPASKLGRCEKCKAFMIGKHTCTKKGN